MKHKRSHALSKRRDNIRKQMLNENLTASDLISYGNFCQWEVCPKLWLPLGDPDVPLWFVQDLAIRFCNMCEFCLSRAFGRMLRRHCGSDIQLLYSSGVLSDYWRELLHE